MRNKLGVVIGVIGLLVLGVSAHAGQIVVQNAVPGYDPSNVNTTSWDVYISEENPNTSQYTWPGNTGFAIRRRDDYPNLDCTAFIKFALPQIEPGNRIVSATLSLDYMWQEWAYPGEWVSVATALKPWTTAATWNTYDGVNQWAAPGAESTADRGAELDRIVVDGYGWKDWNVTSAVSSWYDGTAANNGLVISYSNIWYTCCMRGVLWISGLWPVWFRNTSP